MSKMETSGGNFPVRYIINGDVLEKCSLIRNMKEFLSMHQTMDESDKSTYPKKWLWYMITHGKIPRNSEIGSSEGILNLTDFDPADHAFTRAILERTYVFKQRSQNDWKKRVTIDMQWMPQMTFMRRCWK
jgi:hypothetical protein